MGGSPIVVFKFRGIYTDADTRDALVEAARLVGDDIYLRPIPGCGSFQGLTVLYDGRLVTLGSTAASAATHTGSGAVDIDCEGLTDAQARRVETALRRVGFAAWFRPRVSPSGYVYGWQRHVHGIRMDAPGLPDAAASQVAAYLAGRNGLANRAADTGTRAYVAVRWLSYRKPAARTYTIPKGGTLAKAAAALGVTVAALAGWNHIPDANVVTPGQVVTAPPSTYTPKPTVSPSKPVSRPPAVVVRPKPVKPVSKPHRPAQVVVSLKALKPGKRNASVLRFERALSVRGYLPARYVDGFYGTRTSAATKSLYRGMNRKYPRAGWTPKATVPGPALLRVLKFKVVR